MNLKFAVVVAIGLTSAVQANAQRVGSVGFSQQVTEAQRRSDYASETAVTTNAAGVAVRLLASAGIATGSAIVLAHLGASMEGPCSCDDPGLEGALLGLVTGIVIGAPLGAAAPSMGSVCSLGQRFARSFAGSLLGTALGIATFATTQNDIAVFSVPAFAAGGSVVALGHCLSSRGG